MSLYTEYIAFPTRKDRTNFVAKKFSKYLEISILDVGCYEAPLRTLVHPISYTGVDMDGNPDIKINLEKIDRLPFEDSSFQCVICIDVLEHLDNLHSIFSELVRVTKKNLIVSLPNCWRDARCPIEKGKGHFRHYGLPAEKPNDRHKWFFSITEAKSFVEAKAREFNIKIEEMFLTEKPKNILIRMFRKLIYPKDRYYNRYSQTLWIVFQKQ